MKRDEILDNAKICTTQDRNIQYGEPEDNFGRIAELWSAYLDGIDVSSHDVAMMMILFKVARSASNLAHVDNYIDIAGYAACGGEIASKKKTEPLNWAIK